MVVTTSVMAAIFLLLGIGLLWLALQRGFAPWPEPTPTPTLGPTRTPTPDKRATYVAEDRLTQAAFTATAAVVTPGEIPLPGTTTPPPDQAGSVTSQPPRTGSTISLLPIIVADVADLLPPMATPTPASVFVPSVSGAPATPTATATTDPLAPTATFDPFAATPTATTTPVPGVEATATPTVIALMPTATPSPTYTPAPLTLSEMPATVRAASAPVYIGPSAVYTQITTVNQGMAVRLRGRTAAGDWVYACCLADLTSFWIRPAYVEVTNTQLPVAAPTDADTKSLRWLAQQAPDQLLTPRPTPTSIQYGDFPLARYDAANTGRVPMLPGGQLTKLWPLAPTEFQSGSPFVSPMVVLGQETVIGYNSDGNVYSLFWDFGNQRWKYALQPTMSLAPTLVGRVIYLLNGSTLNALQDQGGAVSPYGQSLNLPNTPQTPINVWLNSLLLGVGDGGDSRLLALRLDNLADQRSFDLPTGAMQMPAIGQEVIYVGADKIYAIDANLFDRPTIETIWTDQSGIGTITAPPVYAYPGVRALAELYVAGGNRVHALDANTGALLWSYDFGALSTALAVNENSVVIAGSGQLQRVSRDLGARQWTANATLNSPIMGGPLITNDRILVVAQDGRVLLYHMSSGNLIDSSQTVPSGVVSGPAVSNGRIFVASGNAVYAFQGN
jgi:outer membrane protein assembly factor BamB